MGWTGTRRRRRPGGRALTDRWILVCGLAGLPVIYLALNAGGFFPGATGVAAATMTVLLMLRFTLAPAPFGKPGFGLRVAGAALGLFAAWNLASAFWSDAPARALIEFDRALLYATTLLFFGLIGRTDSRVRALVWSIAAAVVTVCAIGFVSRALPEVLETAPNRSNGRLSYPISYWNTLGLLAAVGTVLGVHLTTSEREPCVARVLGAAALPMLCATLLLTLSRGALLVAACGLAFYVALARSRALLTGLPVAVVTTAVAVIAAYEADLLTSATPTTPQAVEQGGSLALIVLGCTAAAATLRVIALPLDRKLTLIRVRVPRRAPLLAFGAVALALAAGLLAGVPGQTAEFYREHAKAEASAADADPRDRITRIDDNGRSDLWRVAVDSFEEEPWTGHGAGTYQQLWARGRPEYLTANDAHSLYLEVLAELGIVGLGLLLAALLAMLVGLARRCCGQERAMYAALLAAGVGLLVHAGIDWDWEMPVVMVFLFAAGGLVLGVPPAEPAPPSSRTKRVVAGLACLALTVTPVLMAISQSRLNDSVKAFREGDCNRAVRAALASNAALGMRPEPFQVLGFCDSKLGLHQLAVEAMMAAVERDPMSWEFSYSLALAQGAAGLNPMLAAREALRLSPREPLALQAVRGFTGGSPDVWRRTALGLRLPFQYPREREGD